MNAEPLATVKNNHKCEFFDKPLQNPKMIVWVESRGDIIPRPSDSEPDVLVAGKRAYVAVSPSPKNRT